MAFGDVIQTVSQNFNLNGVIVSFATPTKGNLLVVRIGSNVAGGSFPAAYTQILKDTVDPGTGTTMGMAAYWKIADGTETGINLTGLGWGVGGAMVFQEFDLAGHGVRLIGPSATNSVFFTTARNSSPTFSDGGVVPSILCGMLGIQHDGNQPSNVAMTFNSLAATGPITSIIHAISTNPNFVSLATANRIESSTNTTIRSDWTWTTQDSANTFAFGFLQFDAPFAVAASVMVTGVGTTLTPDISGQTLMQGDLLIAHIVRRHVNAPAAPASQGWSDVLAGGEISRAVGTAFADEVFAKLWGIGDTDDSTPTFTVTAGTNGWGVVLTLWRNPLQVKRPWLSLTDAIIAQATENAEAASNTVTAPDVAYNNKGVRCSHVRLYSSSDDNNLGSPSAGTLVYGGASYASVTGDDFSMASSAEENQSGLSATGTVTVTEAINGPDAALKRTLVLAPLPAPVPTKQLFAPSQAAQQASRW